MSVQFNTFTVFLNRDCPRNCPQCSISDGSRKAMSLEEWKRAFLLLKEKLGVKFFLILGTEPLLMKYDLVSLIGWFHNNKIVYGFYSTSPEPLFSRFKTQLVQAGLENWSCGIDMIPGMFAKDPMMEKKAVEGLMGLSWMAHQGVQTLANTTITNANLDHIPDIIRYCQETIPGVVHTINPVEWRHSEFFDFFSRKEDMEHILIPSERRCDVERMITRVLKMTREPGIRISNTDRHLLDIPKYFDRLDYNCRGKAGPSLDCDGTLRACGYYRGVSSPAYTVWDLAGDVHARAFKLAWRSDVANCTGCHWTFPYSMEEFDAVLFRPGFFGKFFTERHKQPIPTLSLLN